MKNLIYLLALSSISVLPIRALPLQEGLVPKDAKWLVHLDLDTFRESHLGKTVFNDMLAAPLAELKTQMKIDGQLILSKLHSLTAFGTDFAHGPQANGVLLLSGEEDAQKILEGFLAAQILQDTNGTVKKLQQEPFALYSVNGEVFIAPRLGGQIAVSKTRSQLETARQFLTGHGSRGKDSGPFSGYSKVPNTFFLLAVAEGFNENAAIPPQAKILKMAEGARIVLGEKADLLFLNLALKAKDPEVIQQIRQVIEGMTALVALGQSENKELLELVQATKVSSSEKLVTVNIEYPVSKVLGHLDGVSRHVQKTLHPPKHAKHPKSDSDEPGKAESPDQK